MKELHNVYTTFSITWRAGGLTPKHCDNAQWIGRKLAGFMRFQEIPHIVEDGQFVVFGEDNAKLVKERVELLIHKRDPSGKQELICSMQEYLLPTIYVFKNMGAYNKGLEVMKSINAKYLGYPSKFVLTTALTGDKLRYRIFLKLTRRFWIPQDQMSKAPNGVITAVTS